MHDQYLYRLPIVLHGHNWHGTEQFNTRFSQYQYNLALHPNRWSERDTNMHGLFRSRYLHSGGEVQTSNTTVYLVACSLYAWNEQATLDVQRDVLLSTVGNSDTLSQGWSLWSPISNGTDSEVLNAGVRHPWCPLVSCVNDADEP